MKFFSKQQMLRVILRPGRLGNRAMGTEAIPAISARFEGGVVDVQEEETISLLKKSAAFKRGDIFQESVSGDPFADSRKEIEPKHTVQSLKYGHVEETKNAGQSFSPDKQRDFDKIVKAKALELVQKMLKESEGDKEEEVIKTEKVIPTIHDTRTTAPEPLESEDSLENNTTEKDEDKKEIPSEETVSSNVSDVISNVIPTDSVKEDSKLKTVKSKTKSKTKTQPV